MSIRVDLWLVNKSGTRSVKSNERRIDLSFRRLSRISSPVMRFAGSAKARKVLAHESFTKDSEGNEGSSVSILQRKLFIAVVFRSGQNHADNAILQNRLVKVN